MSVYKVVNFENVSDELINKIQPWDIIEDYTGYKPHEVNIDEIAMRLGATYKKYFYSNYRELYSIEYFKDREVLEDCYTQVATYHKIMNTITYNKDRKFHIDIAHDKNHSEFIKLKMRGE